MWENENWEEEHEEEAVEEKDEEEEEEYESEQGWDWQWTRAGGNLASKRGAADGLGAAGILIMAWTGRSKTTLPHSGRER